MNSIIKELVRVARHLAANSSLNVVKPNGLKSLSIPENFEVLTKYKQPGIEVYSGANDWEVEPVCFMLQKINHRGTGERVWVELTPPSGCDDFGYITDKEKEEGLTDKEKTKRIKERGAEFLAKWEEAARVTNEARYEGAKGLPNTLRIWAQTLRDTKELHPYVEICGSDRTEWRKTNLFKDD